MTYTQKNTLKRLMATVFAAAFLISLTSCTAPQKDSELAALPTLKATQDEIFLMDRAALTESEYIMLTSLQGITAQSEANIYIKDSDNTVYLERYLSEHSEITRREFHSVWELVAAFFLGGALLSVIMTPLTYWFVKNLVIRYRNRKAAHAAARVTVPSEK